MGLAVGVQTAQFAIRDHGRCEPVAEVLSPGQAQEITRVSSDQRAEDTLIANNLSRWLD